MKPYYTDYVRHALRFYARYNGGEFKRRSDELNWWACDKAMKNYTDEKDNLIAIYGSRNVLEEAVDEVAKKANKKPSYYWDLLKAFEKQVAMWRGLL